MHEQVTSLSYCGFHLSSTRDDFKSRRGFANQYHRRAHGSTSLRSCIESPRTPDTPQTMRILLNSTCFNVDRISPWHLVIYTLGFQFCRIREEIHRVCLKVGAGLFRSGPRIVVQTSLFRTFRRVITWAGMVGQQQNSQRGVSN